MNPSFYDDENRFHCVTSGKTVIISYDPDQLCLRYEEQWTNGRITVTPIQINNWRKPTDMTYSIHDIDAGERGQYKIIIDEKCDELAYPEGGKILEATDKDGKKHTVIRTDFKPIEPVEFTTGELLDEMRSDKIRARRKNKPTVDAKTDNEINDMEQLEEAMISAGLMSGEGKDTLTLDDYMSRFNSPE